MLLTLLMAITATGSLGSGGLLSNTRLSNMGIPCGLNRA